jgi:chaperone required for assembly of F1-ATPase
LEQLLRAQPEQTTSPFARELPKAIGAARLEEEFQMSSWGLVEGQYDYDRLIQLYRAVARGRRAIE